MRGAPLALSSDYPCGEVDPLHNLRAAVQRQIAGRDGEDRPLQPEQAITPAEAVRAATVTAAAALQAPGAGGLAPARPRTSSSATATPSTKEPGSCRPGSPAHQSGRRAAEPHRDERTWSLALAVDGPHAHRRRHRSDHPDSGAAARTIPGPSSSTEVEPGCHRQARPPSRRVSNNDPPGDTRSLDPGPPCAGSSELVEEGAYVVDQ